jgi:branched-chain amino acid transport system substrate-binding protein
MKAVRELIGQQVELIVGPMTSSIAMAVLPEVNSSHTILLSPTVTTTALTGIDDNFLRVIDDTRTYATKSARYQVHKLGHHSVAVVYDQGNAAYSESWLRDFVAQFEQLGGKVLSSKAFRSGADTSFSSLAREALAARPEVVLTIANAVDAAMIFQQVRKISPRQPLAASEWASTERLIELTGAAAEGAVISQFIDRNDRSPRYLEFRKAFRERFNQEPGFAGLAGYDAALIALEAYARRSSKGSLKEAIVAAGSFPGGQQQIRINRFGDANRASYMTEVRQGSFQTLE